MIMAGSLPGNYCTGRLLAAMHPVEGTAGLLLDLLQGKGVCRSTPPHAEGLENTKIHYRSSRKEGLSTISSYCCLHNRHR